MKENKENKEIKEKVEKKLITSRRKKIKLVSIIVIVIAIIMFSAFTIYDLIKPSIILTSPKTVSFSEGKEFVVNVKLTKLPKDIYPAASIALKFNNERVEFLRIEEGTLGVGSGESFEIPKWSFNVQRSNSIGSVNAMYLDTTTKDKSYIGNNFQEDKDNIVIRYVFKLKSSAQVDDEYSFTIEDAVFATVGGSKDNSSLSMTKNTLNTVDCKIEVVN